LFIAEKFFSLDNTAESIGLSGATASSTIQGWPDICNIYSLFLASMAREHKHINEGTEGRIEGGKEGHEKKTYIEPHELSVSL
jgi:hypothetical protein